MRRRLLLLLAVPALVSLPACGGDKPDSPARATKGAAATASAARPSGGPKAAASAGTSAKPKPSATPSAKSTPKPSTSFSANPQTSGPATQGCARGWTTPARGTALRKFPLDLLRRSQGFKGEFFVHDLRYFKGPDDRNIADSSKQPVVERWYGKVTYVKDPSFRLRFLVRRSPVGSGVDAIAPFDTTGYQMADWSGFDGEGGASTFAGLPGKWPGQQTDHAGESGLPAEVVGCLAE